MDAPGQIEQQLAREDVQRLLERVDVRRDPATGEERADGQIGVDRALLGPDGPLAGQPGRSRGRAPGGRQNDQSMCPT